ncbi:hypothetical protein F2Q69_00005312, partial [Brassica cretica]
HRLRQRHRLYAVLVVSYATSVLRFITNPSTFCYDTIIRVYTIHAPSLSPHGFFVQMRRRSAHPDFHNTLFKSCGKKNGLKAREVVRARELFDSMPFRDLVSWNSLVAGAGLIEQAGEMIEKMPKEGGNREKLLAWSGLLGLGFRIHGNMDMVAEKAAERVKDLSPEGVYSDGGDVCKC